MKIDWLKSSGTIFNVENTTFWKVIQNMTNNTHEDWLLRTRGWGGGVRSYEVMWVTLTYSVDGQPVKCVYYGICYPFSGRVSSSCSE